MGDGICRGGTRNLRPNLLYEHAYMLPFGSYDVTLGSNDPPASIRLRPVRQPHRRLCCHPESIRRGCSKDLNFQIY
jgi:hypothetical protein